MDDLFNGSAARSVAGRCLQCGAPLLHGQFHACKPVAAARATDPDTSHAAARNVEKSGRAESHRAKCLAVVRENPGRTSGEIAVLADLDRVEAARRLPELRGAGLVRNGERRECRVEGTSMMTWWTL